MSKLYKNKIKIFYFNCNCIEHKFFVLLNLQNVQILNAFQWWRNGKNQKNKRVKFGFYPKKMLGKRWIIDFLMENS